MGLQVGRDIPRNKQVVICSSEEDKPPILTLLDSGASDHCFADRSFFTSYTTLNHPSIGLGCHETALQNLG